MAGSRVLFRDDHGNGDRERGADWHGGDHGDGERGELGAGGDESWEQDDGRAGEPRLHGDGDGYGYTGEYDHLVAHAGIPGGDGCNDWSWRSLLLDADGGAGAGDLSGDDRGDGQRVACTEWQCGDHDRGDGGELGAGGDDGREREGVVEGGSGGSGGGSGE